MYGNYIRRIHDHARLDRGLIGVCGKETERELEVGDVDECLR